MTPGMRNESKGEPSSWLTGIRMRSPSGLADEDAAAADGADGLDQKQADQDPDGERPGLRGGRA